MGDLVQFPTPMPYVAAPQDGGDLNDLINQVIRYVNTIVYGSNIPNTVLLKAANLSDVASIPAARINLGLGSAATQSSTAFDAGGAAAAVLASSLQKASNLSDLTNAVTARTNLGLGSAATMSSTAFDPAGAAANRAAKGNNNDITALLDLTVTVISTHHNIAVGDQFLLVLATTGAKTITYGSTVQAGQVRIVKGDLTYNPVNISDGSSVVYPLVAPRVGGYCQGVTVMKTTAGLRCF